MFFGATSFRFWSVYWRYRATWLVCTCPTFNYCNLTSLLLYDISTMSRRSMHEVWDRFFKWLSWLVQVVTCPSQYLTFTLNLPDFSFFSYDDDRVCINSQHKVWSSITAVDQSDSRVGTSNHTKLGYMCVVNIVSLLLRLFQLNVYLSVPRLNCHDKPARNSDDQIELLISLQVLIACISSIQCSRSCFRLSAVCC